MVNPGSMSVNSESMIGSRKIPKKHLGYPCRGASLKVKVLLMEIASRRIITGYYLI
jgi:hypothetical protein